MSALTRTAIGDFTLENAVLPGELTRESLPARLLPPAMAVVHLPRVELSAAELTEISHGRTVEMTAALAPCATRGAAAEALDEPRYAAFDASGNLRAILVRRGDRLGPERYFPPDATD
jgi:tRNA U55 pseudouridine synthase TruB